MGDLVVAREGRVDRGAAAHHVGQDAVHDQVAHDHAHRRPQQRVDPAAVPARPHVPPGRAHRRRPFEDELPAEEHERPRHVEAVREERAIARIGALLGAHPADREDHLVGLAREQVPAARAAVHEQPDPGRMDRARSPRSRRGPSTRSCGRSPSRPSGMPGCSRSSRAGSRPGSHRSARRGRAPTRRRCASRRRATRPWSARCRRASRGAAPAAPARRSRGRGSRERPSP